MSRPRRVTLIEHGEPFETSQDDLVGALSGLDRFTALIGGGPSAEGRFGVFAHRPRAELVVPAGARPTTPPKGAWADPSTRAPDVFDDLRALATAFRAPPSSHPAPFRAGAIATLAYDLRAHVEEGPDRHAPDPSCPDLLARLFTSSLVFDAATSRATVYRAVDEDDAAFTAEAADVAEELLLTARARRTPPLRGPYPTTLPSSSDAPAAYREKIARVVDYVRAGEVYQLNLSQRFDGPCRYSGPEVARRLLKTNPSAFGGLVRLAGPSPAWLCSASPESFLDARGAAVATRPIKGTAPRGADDAEDLRLRAGLVASRKERAELAMIVDLLRNDLATTCEVGSVVVENPWTVETHPTVHHLTAVVRGRLREGADVFDLLRAAWPGGSISGCPKLRATELIDALESFRRGPYTGSLAAFSCEGRTRLNILIRSALVFDEGRARTWGGGGLTFESDPEAERLETLHKVRGVNEALGWETPS